MANYNKLMIQGMKQQFVFKVDVCCCYGKNADLNYFVRNE